MSGEHSGPQPTAAKKASNLVPATIAERDETQKDVTVCKKESEVSMLQAASDRSQSASLLLQHPSLSSSLASSRSGAAVVTLDAF